MEKWLAGLVAAVCVVLLVRLVLSARHRQRADDAVLRGVRGTRARVAAAWRWRVHRKTAEREAAEAIRRAKSRGSWDGNVYRPDSFRDKKRDKNH